MLIDPNLSYRLNVSAPNLDLFFLIRGVAAIAKDRKDREI